MKKQYRLATFALSACLLMACGARETNAPAVSYTHLTLPTKA